MNDPSGVRRGLIGWSGFVGGELMRRARPSVQVRRTDLNDVLDAEIDELICAGAPAEKWRANADPDEDWNGLSRLMAAVDGSRARSCVLISTVDVFVDSSGAAEDRSGDTRQPQAYGRHRALLEEFVEQRFSRSLVVRLPAMFEGSVRWPWRRIWRSIT